MEILRQRGVRLIAINDGVDSARGDDDFTPFRNIMNEYYARDTSRKSVPLSSQKASPASTSQARSFTAISGTKPETNGWLTPEAAEVVKRIFAMTIEGYGPYSDRQYTTP